MLPPSDQTAPPDGRDAIQLFTVDATLDEANSLIGDADALAGALGVDGVDPSRAEVVDPRQLAGVGLSGYLIDGLGASERAVAPDAARLDAVTDPVLILRPGALTGGRSPAPQPPLEHLGSFEPEAATPPGPPLRSDSAEGLVTGAPPADIQRTDRKASGYAALAAIAVALLIAFVMWIIAA